MEAAKRLTVNRDGKPCYDIVYSTDLKDLGAELSGDAFRGRKALIVTDSSVGPLYAKSVKAQVPGECDVYTLPAGEEHKNLHEIEGIYRFLIRHHYDRKSYLIALGGGVTGDMTGYAAATFLRGIDFIQIPTTLLAQADSSIGGKTGVDFEGYKNMVGAFYMPRLVYANVNFLDTLDGRQFASGFAEIMKHGLIRDEEYYTWLIDNMYEIRDRDHKVLQQMLIRSNRIKKEVVEKDPTEKSERMLLNFGHTIGHAIEKYKNFTMTHGECVALGCVAAAYLSWQRGDLPMEEYYEIRDMFVPFGLPISVTDVDTEAVLALTKSDKKVANGTLRFILLHGVGDAFIATDVGDDEIRKAIEEITWSGDSE